MSCLLSTLFVSSPRSSSFPLSTVQQQAGLELGDETVGQQVRVVYDLFSTQFIISSFRSSSFPLCAVQQQAGLGGAGQDRCGRR